MEIIANGLIIYMMRIFSYEEKFCISQADWAALWVSQNKERANKAELLQGFDY